MRTPQQEAYRAWRATDPESTSTVTAFHSGYNAGLARVVPEPQRARARKILQRISNDEDRKFVSDLLGLPTEFRVVAQEDTLSPASNEELSKHIKSALAALFMEDFEDIDDADAKIKGPFSGSSSKVVAGFYCGQGDVTALLGYQGNQRRLAFLFPAETYTAQEAELLGKALHWSVRRLIRLEESG